MKNMKLLTVSLLLAYVLSNCGHQIKDGKRDGKIIVEKIELSPLYQGVNEGSLAYWIDSATMICYATERVHGFTCVPCDSLKRLSNSH